MRLFNLIRRNQPEDDKPVLIGDVDEILCLECNEQFPSAQAVGEHTLIHEHKIDQFQYIRYAHLLTDEEMEVIDLREGWGHNYFDEKRSYKDMATVLAMTPPMARSAVKRVKKRLEELRTQEFHPTFY